MAESKVNQIDGVPFWGHGTQENLDAGITPNQAQDEQEEIAETEPEDDADEEETETEPSSE